MSLNFDSGVTKELKWSSIIWNAAPSGPPTGSGAIAEAPVANGQPVASTSNPALPVPTQPRPQAPPAASRGVPVQHPPHSSNGSGAFPQYPSKVPRGYRAPTGHPYYGQPYPPPGPPYAGHPYPTPNSSSNNTPSHINFVHYQPPPLKSDPKATVNTYYRPRPALDAEARMQQMTQYSPVPHGLPSSQAPLSPVSPTRGSSQLPSDAPMPTKPVASKGESPVTSQLPTPQQN